MMSSRERSGKKPKEKSKEDLQKRLLIAQWKETEARTSMFKALTKSLDVLSVFIDEIGPVIQTAFLAGAMDLEELDDEQNNLKEPDWN